MTNMCSYVKIGRSGPAAEPSHAADDHGRSPRRVRPCRELDSDVDSRSTRHDERHVARACTYQSDHPASNAREPLRDSHRSRRTEADVRPRILAGPNPDRLRPAHRAANDGARVGHGGRRPPLDPRDALASGGGYVGDRRAHCLGGWPWRCRPRAGARTGSPYAPRRRGSRRSSHPRCPDHTPRRARAPHRRRPA